MAEVMAIGQPIQLGVETTLGQAPGGGSSRLLNNLDFHLDPDFAHMVFRGAGRRFSAGSVPGPEYSKLKLEGTLSYTDLVYPLSSLYGAATITTPAGGVNARKWAWGLGLTGALGGKTFQIQRGDGTTNRQWNAVQVSGIKPTLNRKELKLSGDGFGQQVQNGISLTASPSIVAPIAVEPLDWNVYLDYTAAGIGTTQLTRCYKAEPEYTGGYQPNWPMNRSQASYAAIVEVPPKAALVLSVMADSNATALFAAARLAGRCYIRLQAQSQLLVDNYQVFTISGVPTGGTFTLTYKGQTTSAIAYNASSATVQTAVQALSTVGTTGATVAGSNGGPYTVTMAGALANDATLFTHTDSFTGGASPALGIVQTTVPYQLVYDMCAVPVPAAYSDDQGAWVQEFSFEVVEDTSWTEGGSNGTAIYAYLVNNLTGL